MDLRYGKKWRPKGGKKPNSFLQCFSLLSNNLIKIENEIHKSSRFKLDIIPAKTINTSYAMYMSLKPDMVDLWQITISCIPLFRMLA